MGNKETMVFVFATTTTDKALLLNNNQVSEKMIRISAAEKLNIAVSILTTEDPFGLKPMK